jgi:DNA-binding LacI/PurR family transcriptional regulator
VICSSDLMAIGALRAAREVGLRVPGDLSIVGFDGIDAASWTDPTLTTIEQPIGEIAAAAVEALANLSAQPGAALPRVLYRPRLRRGGSTDPPGATPPRGRGRRR